MLGNSPGLGQLERELWEVTIIHLHLTLLSGTKASDCTCIFIAGGFITNHELLSGLFIDLHST